MSALHNNSTSDDYDYSDGGGAILSGSDSPSFSGGLESGLRRPRRTGRVEAIWTRLREPEIKERKYTILAALALLLIGVVLLGFGISALLSGQPSSASVPFLVIGCICFLPGIYQTVILARILLDTPGYTFDQMPSYD
eukprot:TRINITY_DN3207_c0_g1_i1.p1 TRINITY_DN3207_c0_g1~~TRINITY_DN3207_c0_g1_i1.p1  ORF type:complete len:150 (+),score=17.85 TRINITY_DN3207_c0_g1_i1:39-452(+)